LLYHDGRIKPLWYSTRRSDRIYIERELQMLPSGDPSEAVATTPYIERIFGFLGETQA